MVNGLIKTERGMFGAKQEIQVLVLCYRLWRHRGVDVGGGVRARARNGWGSTKING